MDRFDKDAREHERAFLKHLKAGYVFTTGTGRKNFILQVCDDKIIFSTPKSKKPIPITRAQFRRAIKEMLYQRTLTRKELEPFSPYSSALMGLLRLVFSQIAKITRTLRGLLRITLKGLRFAFSGLDRAPKDLELVNKNGGFLALMSYYFLRDDKHNRWKTYLKRCGDMKLILDSGAFSVFKAQQKSKPVEPISVESYAAFIKEHSDVIFQLFNLDVVGDSEQSKKNAEYLRSQGLNPIEVWHVQSGWDALDELVKTDAAVIGVGGTALMTKQERRKIFKELFRRYPANNHNFHLLGGGTPIICEFDWFSADASTWMAGRTFRRLVSPVGQRNAPAEWSTKDCLEYNIRQLSSLETNYQGVFQTTLIPQFA